MASDRILNRRKQGGFPSAEEALSRGFDHNAMAHVHRSVGPRVQYRATTALPHEADGELVFSRTVAVDDGADAAPNSSQPSYTKYAIGASADVVIYFTDHVPADITALVIETWCMTDLHVGGLASGAPIWVLVDEQTVTPYQEYVVRTGQRPAYLRVKTIAGGAGNDCTLYATVA